MSQSFAKKLPEWIYPLALLLIALGVYGPFLPQLGYYWDDWVFAWTRSQAGIEGLVALFNLTRPIRGWYESLLTPLLGMNPVVWQFYALTMRWLGAVSFWWFLRALWPERRAESLLAASMVLLFPGYSQQPVAMTYQYYWTFNWVLFLSFSLMVRTLRPGAFPPLSTLWERGKGGSPTQWGEGRRWWLYAVSVALALTQMIALEYMVGLEVLRPVVLWLVFTPLVPNLWDRLKKTILFYLPYGLSLGGYIYWRFFLYKGSIYAPELLDSTVSPVQSISNLLGKVFSALWAVNVTAWLRTVSLPVFDKLGLPLTLVYILVSVGLLAGGIWFFSRNDQEQTHPSIDWIFLGLAGMLVAGVPFFMAGLPFRLAFPEDRITMPYMPLFGMFVAGLLSLIRDRKQRALVIGLALALAAGWQMQNLLVFRDDWKVQKNFLWQLAWRAPDLKPGTSILSEDYDTFAFNDDESMNVLVTWMYAPEQKDENFIYHYSFMSLRLENKLPEMLAAAKTTASQSIVIRYAPPGCLHALDPRYDSHLLSLPNRETVTLLSAQKIPLVPQLIQQALPLSNPAQILPNLAQPTFPPAIFGAEPAHGWCYTYLQADLARQQGDWETVAHLGDEAFAVPLLPDDPYEYLPFIEAYARLGRVKDARLLTRQVADNMPLLKPALCALWERAGQQAAIPVETVDKLKSELQVCPVP